ncbi:MAG: excinuclease ABC subunit UvrA [Clostridia bacterium]|nr:excinuclease ABC subunit UvrA [Clostridia bacterium]
MEEFINIVGAKENNLKNISVKIPRNKLVLFTGLSGSGKSSLAFDTIFAEGQRRYMESLSSYARQFLGQMKKPDVELIEGLSPAIAIDQKVTSSNPRSTVGTVTEIYDYLRLLYAHIGKAYCVNCGTEISANTVDSIVDKVMKFPEGAKIMVIAPIVRGKKGEFAKLFEDLIKQGYVRGKVDGNIVLLDELPKLDKKVKHTISVVIDRIVVKKDVESRLASSIETAVKLSEGLVVIENEGSETLYSTKNSCKNCGYSFSEITPRLFSFNTPFGACPECSGIGNRLIIDENMVVRHPERTLKQNPFVVIGFGDAGFYQAYIKAMAKEYGFSLDVPYQDLPREVKDLILYGNGGKLLKVTYESANFSGSYESAFEGIINNLYRRSRESKSEHVKDEIEKLMVARPCESCHGKRLNRESLSVKVGGKNIFELCDMSVEKINEFLNNLELTKKESVIAENIVKEIRARLKFLIDVGLEYLTLTRSSGTLSGGEAQRIRLATQIGSGLVGVLYILDEPSIGLHPRDTHRLIKTMERLRDLGNTVIVVEHDEDTIRAADFVVDIGPKAGAHGGRVVATGSPEEIMKAEGSITGQYLSGAKTIPVPKKRRKITDAKLQVIGARQNNLKNIDVEIPLGVFTAVTGVSGSGKSSLVNEIIYPALSNKINKSSLTEGEYSQILGAEQLDKVVVIDQSPIGRTPRSNPATYTGVFTAIRDLFASLPESNARGYTSGRFSFNIPGGRCEACGGDGVLKIEMHFLPDVYVTCDECGGKRYNRETLEVKYKGKSINDVLEMTVEDALDFFANFTSIKNKIQALYDVGLGYIKLGQPATTLSGGEAQRVKLATELSKRPTGKTMYILDEPTTGLHTHDVSKLINILQRLVDGGNTVLVIEHNLDMIKVADNIIDIGPEGGDKGGKIVATGTPEEIAKYKKSYTGKALLGVLN